MTVAQVKKRLDYRRARVHVSTADGLRDLAKVIENQTLASPVLSVAMPIVRSCVDNLNALARVYELNGTMEST